LILPDVNVFIYAFRRDSPEHVRHKAWLEEVINGAEAYGVAPQVLSSVVRVTTHPRIFAQPSRLDEVLAFSRAIMEQPIATLIVPGERHWQIFEQLCQGARAMGNLVQDAWFAALAIESGCEWITHDRDYARFNGLKWRTPW